MWRAYGRIDRLKTALKYRKINPEKINIYDLKDTLIGRGISDSKLCDIYHKILSYLEPKGCQMPHCESHGVDGFCGCYKNLVPSKCKKHREFLKRCKQRASKAADQLLKAIGNRYINYEINYYYVYIELEKKPKFAFVSNWSYRLRTDVWDEIKRRKKIK